MTPGTAFVTGGAGFVGAHVVRALLAEGWAVRVLARPAGSRRNLQGLDAEVVEGDLREPSVWEDRVHGCRWLFHVAAFYQKGLYGSTNPEDAAMQYAINLSGTSAVLKAAAAAGVERVVHTSTIGAIGRPDGGSPPDENTPFNLWARGSHYVRSKYLGELAARFAAHQGLPVVIVHPTAPVGALDYKPTATGRRIADFLEGRRPGYLVGGINFVPVADVAQGHLLAAARGQVGRRYILGHGEGNLSESQFLSLLTEIARRPIPPGPEDPRPWWRRWLRRRLGSRQGRQPMALTANPARAIRELGLPQSDLRAAFAEAVEWFTENQVVSRRTPSEH